MEKVKLGATALEVGVAGLGCGGHSRLGMANGGDENHAVGLVREAMDLGIDFLDTARAFKAVGERTIKKVPALSARTVVNLFVEPSTRTRISFELANSAIRAFDEAGQCRRHQFHS